MKLSHIIFLFVALGLCRLDSADVPVFPAELQLTNHVTLHHATPTKWTSEYVVVRHVGGVDPIRYTSIAEPQRALVMSLRPSAKSASPRAEAAPNTIHVDGQCFITTQGAGTYRMSEVVVMFFPASAASAFDTNMQTVDLPRPLHTCKTDADGKISIDLPAGEGPWLVVSQASRRVGALRNGDPWERYEWRVPYDGSGPLNLTGANCLLNQHTLRISQ